MSKPQVSVIRQLPVPYFYCILIGTGLGLLLGTRFYWTFLLYGEAQDFAWDKYFMAPFINHFLWGFLTPLVFYFYKKYTLVKGASTRLWIKALAAGVGLSLFHEIISYIIWMLPSHLLGWEKMTVNMIWDILYRIPAGFISQIVTYWIIYLVFAGLDYAKRYQAKALELARMETQLSQAQLHALRLQVQPHFLFNALNTISSLMEINTKDAQRMMSKLGALLRSGLSPEQRNLLPLWEEMQLARNYLDIEQIRFHDRLRVAYYLDDAARQCLVPSLILQPLVENAIKHGFARHSGAATIEVRATLTEDGKVQMEVIDDGVGTDIPGEQLLDQGIGLSNVRERLALLYPGAHRMSICSSSGKGFRILIEIPVVRAA